MSQLPKISIVTPSYNQGHLIEQTIQSVLGQGYPDLEFIIIDGGSTDNTIEVVKKYQDKLSYWVSEPDNGQSDALNKGLKRCTGKVFNWLNSDDLLHDGVLHKIGEEFLKEKTTIVTGATNIWNETTGAAHLYRPEMHATLAKTVSRPCFHQPSTYMLADYAKKYTIDPLLHYAMDMELYTRYLMEVGQEGVVVLDDTISTFRIHDSSKTGTVFHIFINDIASVYNSMALKCGFTHLAKKVMHISNDQRIEGYEFPDDVSDKRDLVKAIVENYIYKYVVMLYDGTKKNMDRSAELLRDFEGTTLLKEDKVILEKIRTRVPFRALVAIYKSLFNSKG